MHTGMSVVTLGTAGGPLIRRNPSNGHHQGIATAVVVDSTVYLVDCGRGITDGLAATGLRPVQLGGIFLTHHHSDHVIDLNSVMVLGGLAFRGQVDPRIDIYGPGPREVLPPYPHDGPVPDAIFPEQPTPGTAELVDLLLRAHATDLNDRRRDSKAPDISEIFRGHDIELPQHLNFHANDNNHPAMDPIEVFADERVRVTATLVQHEPVAPAFGFRFDSKYGSVTISGDTAPSSNLVRLAAGSDLLLHEAIDLEAVAASYPNATPDELAASMGHHRRAHTTAEDAGRIASQAGVRHLALHHLVPAHTERESWLKAQNTFDGELLIPQDFDVLHVRAGKVSFADSVAETAKS